MPTFERTKFILSKGDYSSLSRELNAVDWQALFGDKDANECNELFLSEYNKACKKWIPLSTKFTGKAQPPWMTKALASLIALKKRLWFRLLHSTRNAPALCDEYKTTCKSVRKETKRAVIEYERMIVGDKKNSKRLFGYAKSKQKTTKTITAMRDKDGLKTTDITEISNILNDYFKSVFVIENDAEAELPAFESRTESRIASIQITEQDIASRLSKLDPHKAPGNDGVHPHVLSKSPAACAVPLALIFERSLKSGQIPDGWRVANITALHKKGSRLDPCNYRPVSLTSLLSKVLERIVRDSILEFLYASNLIASQQHGFVRNKTCTTNLLESLDFITNSLAYKHWIDLILLDFASI